MAVSQLEVTRRTSYPFGYERSDGIRHFAVDPTHPANVRITDLGRAPRDADGRPSIAERYRDRDDYVARARASAQQLAAAGYLLEEDVELVVELAAQRFDILAPQLASAQA